MFSNCFVIFFPKICYLLPECEFLFLWIFCVGIFQCFLYIICCVQTHSKAKCFFRECSNYPPSKKTIGFSPCDVCFCLSWCRRFCSWGIIEIWYGVLGWSRIFISKVTKQFLAFSKGQGLFTPQWIICGAEFESNKISNIEWEGSHGHLKARCCWVVPLSQWLWYQKKNLKNKRRRKE